MLHLCCKYNGIREGGPRYLGCEALGTPGTPFDSPRRCQPFNAKVTQSHKILKFSLKETMAPKRNHYDTRKRDELSQLEAQKEKGIEVRPAP